MNPTINVFTLLLFLYLTSLAKMEKTINVVEGSNIILYCSLNGSYKQPEWNGPPNYTIYLLRGEDKLNDKVLSVIQNRLRISENTVDLILSRVHKNDSGLYQCQYDGLGVNRFNLVVNDSVEQQLNGDMFRIVLIVVIVGGVVVWIILCTCVILVPRCCGCKYAILKKLYKHHNRPWSYLKVVALFIACCCFIGWIYIFVKFIQTKTHCCTGLSSQGHTCYCHNNGVPMPPLCQQLQHREKHGQPNRSVTGTTKPLIQKSNAKPPQNKASLKMPSSKFKNAFGKALKREECYDNIRITKSSVDSMFCSVNPKYLAVIIETTGGGAFMVLPLSRTGRVEQNPPVVSGHTSPVLDIKFCPHDDDVIASCSEDCTVKVWKIPKLFSNLKEPTNDLKKHEKKVNFIEWHPTALDLLLSSGADNKLFLWNCGKGEVVLEVEMPDLCLSCSFSYDGSKFATTCKDTNIKVYDARTGNLLKEGKGHEGIKPSKCVYLKENKIFTTGFTKMGERQCALWNVENLDAPMNKQDIDREHGVIFPLYDPDTNLIWLCGKGDCNIRFYEVTDNPPYLHFLSQYQSNQPQRGIGMMPKRGLNVNICEIARFYKLLNTGLCEVIPFIVPRQSDCYQEDLYPDTASGKHTLTAEDFMKGKKSSEPQMMSMSNSYVSTNKPLHVQVHGSAESET